MNIFVAKLNFKTKESELQELFEAYGEVNSVKIITDQATGKSKGFGFVEMNDSAEALEAIKQLDDTDFGGYRIVVKEARPREERPSFNSRPPRDRNNERSFNRREDFGERKDRHNRF
ncbi:MAG: RNA-binding protein [Chitinophagales bacterium]|nr:RNA-binding protein [Bacteroidota bacterium]MCB9043954.1 RNA-binding protein [Chitinophagales bacterium]